MAMISREYLVKTPSSATQQYFGFVLIWYFQTKAWNTY